jgi:membrane protein YqaA with SNARE-associated domain
MFQRLYHWTLALAESRRAPWALAVIAFAESSFFPIPPDVILVPMSLARPRLAWGYAALCTAASVAGGALGYAIGALLFDTIGQWLISLYGYAQKIDTVRQFYQEWGAAFILVKGLTPIPFKLVTIVSGLLGFNFGLFILLALITRGARFFMLAALLNNFGEPIKAVLEKNFGVFMGLLVFFIALGFWVAYRLA